MKKKHTVTSLLFLSLASTPLSYAAPEFIEETQEEHAWKVVVGASEMAVSGAHGAFSGGDPYHAPREDVAKFTAYKTSYVTRETVHTIHEDPHGFSFIQATVRATEFSVRGAHGQYSGGGVIHSVSEDLERYDSQKPLLGPKRNLTDKERLEELEKETKALRAKLEKEEEEEKESGWWKWTKRTFNAVKETVGLAGAIIGIVVAIIALV